jgi:uncharacterized protein YehS (DUF1456 family)
MTNNDILRRLRYTFDFNDDQMIDLFKQSGKETTREEISNWLKKDDDPEYESFYDVDFAYFLNGLIILNRGKKGDELPKAEKSLNNNIVFRKLKIALNLRDEDILDILTLVDFRFSKHELSAFFRKPEQNQYRPCKDQILRNFVHGLQIKYRPQNDTPND